MEDETQLRDQIEALDWVIADRERELSVYQREQQRLLRRWNGMRRTMWDDWDASRLRELQAAVQDTNRKLQQERAQRNAFARVLGEPERPGSGESLNGRK